MKKKTKEQDTLTKKPVEMKKKNYTIQVNYSQKAIDKKLMKFITPSGDEFEISADEMATILVGQVNSELIEATFVESDRVNVVEVTRQIRVRADRDIRKGEEIRLEYTHPYPVEFALIEEAAKLAILNKDVPVRELTVEYIQSVKNKITPKQKRFVDLVYKFFKSLVPKKPDTGT
jgi:SET domain-containing protein